MYVPLASGASLIHGDPIAPVILGVIDDAIFSAIVLVILPAPPLFRLLVVGHAGNG